MINRRDALKVGLKTASSLAIVSTTAYTSSTAAMSNSPVSPSDTIRTRLTRHYGLQHPVICAGMAFVCDTPALCIAVCKAGGIGSLSGSLLSPATLKSHIQEIKSATTAPFHINFLSPFIQPAQVQTCVEENVPIISFHWGLPDSSVLSQVKNANIAIWAQVGTVSAAKEALEAEVDAIVVQGGEAGGHNYGGMPLLALFSAIKSVVPESMLLFAAGGISDGLTAAAALVAGADGVWIGTRLVATREANAHDEYKKRLVRASGEDTILTSVFGPENPTFNPVRVIKNETVSQWHDRVDEIPKDRSAFAPIGTSLFGEQQIPLKEFDSIVPVPQTTGDFDKMPMLAGQGVGLVRTIPSVQTAMEDMMSAAAEAVMAMDAS
ncbi:MAG: NAD(P)H-dependent flavin oxidoreductase [Halioglobus sp.]